MIELLFLIGLLAVASNPSPYYGALGLVVGAVFGSLILFKMGMTFLSLVLLLIYLGGMMVVFAYCTALVASPYPETWGNVVVLNYLVCIAGATFCMLSLVTWLNINEDVFYVFEWGEVYSDWLGVSQTFSSGGLLLLFGGLALLLALVVVFEVVRGHYSGTLRAV
uniref:NADH-ubiquinone oxidoreductase chain 6 n=1 Tax=Hyperolius marmoratus TaxID=476017 RepID=W0TJE0_HYPMR|nr:NADH dehydrogenase subunit 6 [Hyperolius marmoratus]BAO42921.1 NADH dehydrogenase subunit 6 [Hyperolius marmoratus]